MIRIEYSKRFLKSAKDLPESAQIKLAELLVILNEDPFDSHLHTKKLKGELAGFYSFRITRDWRAIFQFNNPEIIKLLRVGNRNKIYR